jgi:signal transduction histidine kinase
MRASRFRSVVAWAALLAPLAATFAAAQPLEPKYEETRELMDLVRDAAELVTSQGVEAACAQFRVADSRWYRDDSYVFVLGMDGEALCHPARPSLEGRSLLELRDPKGKPIVANFIRELQAAEQGWVHYLWPRPGGGVFYWKTSHVRRAEDPSGRQLIVGSGRYEMTMEPFFVVEQVEDAIQLIRQRGTAEAFAALHDKSSGFLFYNAYVFVLDENGTLLVNNAFPENEGKDLTDLADIDGKKFVREMLAVPPGESAWIDYKWPRPGDTWPSAKSSYVRNVEIDGQQLYVGSGVYFGLEPKDRGAPPLPADREPAG